MPIARHCFAAVLSLVPALAAYPAAASPDPALSCQSIGFPGGSVACRDYVGDDWSPATASSDCASLPGATTAGSLAVGSSCSLPNTVGTCTLAGGTPNETRLHFESGDPSTLESSCVGFLQGTWSTPVAGSCDHMMVFGPPGTPAMPVCKQYPSTPWTAASAEAECDALPQSAFSPAPCAASPLGFCTVADAELHFYVGDPAALSAGCETPAPYGLGGQWTPAQTSSLPAEVVAALTSDPTVSVTPNTCIDDACLGNVVAGGGAITFAPSDGAATRGLVIYPGGMVEPRAYAVAARAIAEQGFFVAVVPFPGNLPITEPMRGLGTVMANPQITHWAVAGHSLGGVAASIWAVANPAGKLRGIALWASYPAPAMGPNPAADLSGTSLKGLSITATHDGVLNWDAYESTRDLLPAATHEVSLRGGNHAQFGYYGDQSGDQPAKISREHQHALFAGATVHLLNRLGLDDDSDRIHPVHERMNSLVDAVCTPLQVHMAGMKNKDLRASQVVNSTFAYETDFVLSKSDLLADGSGVVAVTSHAHQGANAWDITAPPVFDTEVWCKMKSQEAIAAHLGVKPQWQAGTCGAANQWVFDYAMSRVGLGPFLRYWFSGTDLQFHDDIASASGPQWLATGVTLSDLGDDVFGLQASGLHTPLVGPPAPYNGNEYCKVWTPQAAAQFILRQAFGQ